MVSQIKVGDRVTIDGITGIAKEATDPDACGDCCFEHSDCWDIKCHTTNMRFTQDETKEGAE